MDACLRRNKKLSSCRKDTARCFVSLNISLSHFRSVKVTRLFDAEYFRNSTRYRHSYNKILIGTYTLKGAISCCNGGYARPTLLML